jgi:acetyl esterase/lipase
MLSDPRVSPLMEPDLTGLPPGVVRSPVNTIRCAIRGEAYAQRLMAAGH